MSEQREDGVQEYTLESTVPMTIRVREDSDAITRVTGPDGDGWRASFYDLYTQQDVFDMWINNAIRNGVHDVSRLDGWGDLALGDATVEIGQ